jgi:hypothetical protein
MPSLTLILAVWGALVSSFVAGWNFYRDYIRRDRVVVQAGLHIWSVTGNTVFFLKVLNASSHLISVTHCAGYEKHIFRWRWLRLLLRQPESGYLFAFETLNKLRLPYKIEAWDHQLFLYKIDEHFPQGHLYVITADDRNHFCPRANLKAIHADEMYKSIHPDERSAPPYWRAARNALGRTLTGLRDRIARR